MLQHFAHPSGRRRKLRCRRLCSCGKNGIVPVVYLLRSLVTGQDDTPNMSEVDKGWTPAFGILFSGILPSTPCGS